MARRLIAKDKRLPGHDDSGSEAAHKQMCAEERRSKTFGFNDECSTEAPMKACVGPAARGSPQRPGLAPGPTLLRPQTFAARRRVSRANPLYGRCQRAELDRL